MVSETLEGKLDSFETKTASKEDGSYFQVQGPFKVAKVYKSGSLGYCVAVEAPWNSSYVLSSHKEDKVAARASFDEIWTNLTEKDYRIVLTGQDSAKIVPYKKD